MDKVTLFLVIPYFLSKKNSIFAKKKHHHVKTNNH